MSSVLTKGVWDDRLATVFFAAAVLQPLHIRRI